MKKTLAQLVRSHGCFTQLVGEAQKGLACPCYGGRKIQSWLSRPRATNHFPLNCDELATTPDKYWEANLSPGSPFYSLRLLSILGQRISFRRETQLSMHGLHRESHVCTETSSSRYPLFLTHLFGKYLTSKIFI